MTEVIHIRAAMNHDQRTAAIAALAAGCRTVEMPVQHEFAQGVSAHRADRNRLRGDVRFEASNGLIYGVRLPVTFVGMISGPGIHGSGVQFSGSADPSTRTVTGQVTSQLTQMNRLIAISAAVAVVIALLIALIAQSLVLALVLPVVVAVAALGRWVTPKREARLMLRDLERIAALAA